MRNQGHRYVERVGSAAEGTPLDRHLAARGAHVTLGEWRDRIASGAVRVDGKRATADQPLRAGQVVTWDRPPWDEPDVPRCTAVLHEDEDLLAVAKPRGLPTLPGGGLFAEGTLLAVVRRRAPEAAPLHRLGRHTSGVVLFARIAAARSPLQALFRERRVRKIYRALAAGHPADDDFEVAAPIGEVPYPPTGSLHAASDAGRPSRSRVRVLERRHGDVPTSLVEVEIETGRPHQIRIHLAFAGHPLAGDPLYAAGGLPVPDGRAVPGDGGYLLHAASVELAHPRTGARIVVACAPPPALRTSGPG